MISKSQTSVKKVGKLVMTVSVQSGFVEQNLAMERHLEVICIQYRRTEH